jgi:hypothetical protein
LLRSRDSSVGIATGYWLDDWGVRFRVPVGSRIFFFSTSSRPVLGPTQLPIQLILGALSPWVKRPVREADHSLPTSAEVKKTWICTSTPPYAFMAQCLINQAQGQLYFYFYSLLTNLKAEIHIQCRQKTLFLIVIGKLGGRFMFWHIQYLGREAWDKRSTVARRCSWEMHAIFRFENPRRPLGESCVCVEGKIILNCMFENTLWRNWPSSSRSVYNQILGFCRLISVSIYSPVFKLIGAVMRPVFHCSSSVVNTLLTVDVQMYTTVRLLLTSVCYWNASLPSSCLHSRWQEKMTWHVIRSRKFPATMAHITMRD